MSRDFPQESLEVYQLHQPCLAMYNPIHLSSWQSSYVVSNTAGTVFHIKNYCTVKDALSLESSSASLGFPLATITLFTGNALKKKMSKEILLGPKGFIALNGRPSSFWSTPSSQTNIHSFCVEILTPARKSKGPLIWVCLGLFKCPWWLKIRLLWNVASCSTLWLPGRHFSHVQTTLVVVVVDSLTNKSPGTELLVSGIILRPKHHNDYLGLKTSVIPELVIRGLSCWWHILGGRWVIGASREDVAGKMLCHLPPIKGLGGPKGKWYGWVYVHDL